MSVHLYPAHLRFPAHCIQRFTVFALFTKTSNFALPTKRQHEPGPGKAGEDKRTLTWLMPANEFKQHVLHGEFTQQ